MSFNLKYILCVVAFLGLNSAYAQLPQESEWKIQYANGRERPVSIKVTDEEVILTESLRGGRDQRTYTGELTGSGITLKSYFEISRSTQGERDCHDYVIQNISQFPEYHYVLELETNSSGELSGKWKKPKEITCRDGTVTKIEIETEEVILIRVDDYDRIVDFTNGRRKIEDLEFLTELYSGNLTIEDNGEERHDSKAVLFVTDYLTDDTRIEEAGDFIPAEGEFKIWIHYSFDEVWVLNSELPEGVQAFFDILDSEDVSVYDIAKLIQTLDQGVDSLATGLYELFDWLSKGIEKARIPEYVWNCEGEKYDPTYAKVYKYASIIFNPIAPILRVSVENVLKASDADPEIKNLTNQLSEGRIEFAFYCGMWNGVIEIGRSIPEIGKLLIGPLSSKGREAFSKFIDQLSKFKKEDKDGNIECEGTWCAIKIGIASQFDPVRNSCRFSEFIGELVIPIAISFIDPVALAGTIQNAGAKVVLQIVRVLQLLDKLGDPFQYFGASLRMVNSTLSRIRNPLGEILVEIENRIFRASVLFEDGIVSLSRRAEQVQMAFVTPNLNVSLTEGVGGAISKTGKALGSESLKTLQRRGARIKDLTRLLNKVDNPGVLLNKLKLAGLEKDKLRLFIKDLDNSSTLRAHFKNLDTDLNQPKKLAQAWDVISEADDVIRQSPDQLKKLSTFMSESGMKGSRLKDPFKNAKKNGTVEKWIEMKIPEAELDKIYKGLKESPPASLTPWTPQHKAQRWANYKEGNPDADFKTWSNIYDGNINKSLRGAKATDDYFKTLNWNCTTCREVPLTGIQINTPNGIETFTRRLDIADLEAGIAIEFKKYASGKVYRSPDIRRELALDKELLRLGSLEEIRWVFQGCEPSKYLRRDLEDIGVIVEIIP